MKTGSITMRALLMLTVAHQMNIAAVAQDDSATKVNPSESTTSEVEAPGLNWSTDFSASLDEAQKNKKLVLADFYTEWCGWCKHLDKTTFADPKFVEYVSENFIPVKLNAEDKGEGTRTAEHNDVSAYPTGLVFAPNGKVIGRIFGYLDAAKYKSKLRKIAKHAPKKG